jgi:two-component system, sensor histidine kinase
MANEERREKLQNKTEKRSKGEPEIERLNRKIERLEKLILTNREKAQKAEKSSFAKEVYLARMSHEIRNPLNAILGLGKLLSQTELDNKQKELLSSIRSASESLLVVINDILDFSKIEAGKIAIEHVGFDLKKLALDALNVLQHKAEEKMLSLFLEMDKNIAPVLIGDPYRINQVLMNMLSNAVKFTEEGSVSIKASLGMQSKGFQQIQIVIKDTGIGINEDYLKHLFDEFSQEDGSVARKFGGTGLGMSISKQLVDLMGGTLNVESKKNEGTMVTINLSLETGTESDLKKSEEFNGDTSIINNKRILLVEDDAMNRLITNTSLSRQGALLVEAENGAYALEILKKSRFDLVLMDVRMPFMDGFEATKIIREELKSKVPIIALTANALKGNDKTCIEAGMNDFISKPYDEKTLLQIVLKWLGGNTDTTTPNDVSNNTKNGYENISIESRQYNLAKLRTIGTEDFVLQMLQLFIREVPESVNKIKNAYEANDFHTVKYITHRIRPSITNLEINQLKKEIVGIEELAGKAEKSAELEKMIEKLVNVVSRVVTKIKADHNL